MKKNINNNMYKLIFKTMICFGVICLFLMISCSFKTFAASRYEYVFEMKNGDVYTIIANASEEGYKIIGSYSEIRSKKDSSIASGSSLYDLIVTDYELASGDAKKERGAEILRLLELFVSNRKNSSGADTVAELSFNGKIILVGDGGEVKYENEYDEIIKKAEKKDKNPYYLKDGEHNRSKILYNSQKLDELYTDLELINAYERCTNNSLKGWIKKSATTNSFLVKGDYKIMLDTYTEADSIILKVTNQYDTVVASFLIAERLGENTKYEELIHGNDFKLKWFSSGKVEGIGIDKELEQEELDLDKPVDDKLTYTFDKNINFYYSKSANTYETISTSYEIKNIDQKYYRSQKIIIPSTGGFVALKNSSGGTINVYLLEYEQKSDGTENKRKCIATMIGQVPLSALDSFLTEGDLKTSSQGWTLSKENNVLRVYKSSEVDIEGKAYYLNLANLYNCYTKDKKHYDIAIPIKKGRSGEYSHNVSGEEEELIALITSSADVEKNYDDGTLPLNSLFSDAYKSSVDMYLTIYEVKSTLSEDKLGRNVADKLDVPNKTYFYTNEQYSSLPPKISIKEFLTTKDMKEKYAGFLDGSNEGVNDIFDDTTGVTIEFVGELIGYGKTLLALLIFIGVVMAGLQFSISGSVNAQERAKTILKFKHLIFGIIILLVMIPAVVIAMDYMDQGFNVLEGIASQFDEIIYAFDEKDEDGLILEILTILIRITNDIMAGLIDLFGKMLTHSSQGIDYIALIYDCYDENGYVSALKPFENEVEWTRCLTGYGMLASVGYFILLIAVVKTAFEYIFSAGNEKKITQIKETWNRIFWAVILIVSVPYIIQSLIYLMNYLTAAVPVNTADSRFNLDVILARQDTFMSALSRNIFLTTKCNIYMTFLVRKVMLSILLVSGPIVIATWAVSEKFRSFHIWIGEVITNIAMQFCYAIGFLVVVLLSYDSENAIYGIILVSLSITLSKFIKDSLQGYFQKWGGIDEEAVGSSVVGKAFGWGKKAKNIFGNAGKLLAAAGGKLENAGTSSADTQRVDVNEVKKAEAEAERNAKKDKSKNSNENTQEKTNASENEEAVHRDIRAKAGIAMQNVGAIMQGDVDKFRFGRDIRLEDMKKKAEKDKQEEKEKEREYEKSKNKMTEKEKEEAEKVVEGAAGYADGKISDEDFDAYMEDNKKFFENNNDAKEYIEAKRKASKSATAYTNEKNKDVLTKISNRMLDKTEMEYFGQKITNPDSPSQKSSRDSNESEPIERTSEFDNEEYEERENDPKITDDKSFIDMQVAKTATEEAKEIIAKAQKDSLLEQVEKGVLLQQMEALETAKLAILTAAEYDSMNFQCNNETAIQELIRSYAEQKAKVYNTANVKIPQELIEEECTKRVSAIYRKNLKNAKKAMIIAKNTND